MAGLLAFANLCNSFGRATPCLLLSGLGICRFGFSATPHFCDLLFEATYKRKKVTEGQHTKAR